MRVLLHVLLVAALAAALVDAQVTTNTVQVPATGSQGKVEVKVTQEEGRQPNHPPQPPSLPSAPLADGQNGIINPVAAQLTSGAVQLAPAAQLTNGNPVPAQLVIPAASVSSSSYPVVNFQALNNQQAQLYVQGAAGARIDDNAACASNSNCLQAVTVQQQLESAITDVKNQIVNQAMKLQADNVWVKQVQAIIKHYQEKIRNVQSDTNFLKNDIRRLFAQKKKYEDALMQYALNQDHFQRVAETLKQYQQQLATTQAQQQQVQVAATKSS